MVSKLQRPCMTWSVPKALFIILEVKYVVNVNEVTIIDVRQWINIHI